VDERRELAPGTQRAHRRVDAERSIERWADEHGVRRVILRVPGIYAADRLPLERLRKGIPVLQSADDVYTAHIHADDLAQIVVRALLHPDAEGAYNTADDSTLLAGDWLDLVADRARLPRPPRVSRSEAHARIPAAHRSFLSESRRLRNERMKRGLGVVLRYPTVYEGLPSARDFPCAQS
jgi:nucleoside-diphosphate-sugar epimerase